MNVGREKVWGRLVSSPDPTHKMGKGRVTCSLFLVVLNQHSHDISLQNVLAHMLFADSAQPRKASNVTRPYPILWVGSGDETRGRQEM